MVIRVISVPDSVDLPEFDEVFRAVLGWDIIGFIFSVLTPVLNSSDSAGFHESSRNPGVRRLTY